MCTNLKTVKLLFSVNNVNFACHASKKRYRSKIEIRDRENNDVHSQTEQSVYCLLCLYAHPQSYRGLEVIEKTCLGEPFENTRPTMLLGQAIMRATLKGLLRLRILGKDPRAPRHINCLLIMQIKSHCECGKEYEEAQEEESGWESEVHDWLQEAGGWLAGRLFALLMSSSFIWSKEFLQRERHREIRWERKRGEKSEGQKRENGGGRGRWEIHKEGKLEEEE